jgi:hypothetical protein
MKQQETAAKGTSSFQGIRPEAEGRQFESAVVVARRFVIVRALSADL